MLVRISPLIRLPVLGQFSFLMRRAAELGPQIESGLLLLSEDPGYVPLVSLGVVYARSLHIFTHYRRHVMGNDSRVLCPQTYLLSGIKCNQLKLFSSSIPVRYLG